MKLYAWVYGKAGGSGGTQLADGKRLKSLGLDGVFVAHGSAEEVAELKANGLEVHIWMWTVNRADPWIVEHHPDWYQVSRSGKSCLDMPPYVPYYKWVSPCIPAFRQYITERAVELSAIPGVDGIHLDYVRYPDVRLPRGLWSKYDLDQTEELPDYDFCYSPHTLDAFEAATGRLPDPIRPDLDQDWLHFRYKTVTELVEQIASAVRSKGKSITAAVFPTPAQARVICRQDWAAWHLDAYCPMLYHSFYNAEVDWIGDCLTENLSSVTEPIIAGLYMPAMRSVQEFRAALDQCAHRGAAGVSLFGEVPPEFWTELSRWKESLQ